MVRDREVCNDCHYMEIKSYSLRERHCRKCSNYGEKVRKACARIIQAPVEVKIDCPHCDYEIEIDYKEYETLMTSSYPGDWGGENIECPYCEKTIEVEEYDWV